MEEITKICDYHTQLLLCFDGYISCMKTKRFHLNDEIINKQRRYQEKMLQWERFLQMSITTKSHLIEDHSDQQERFAGIGDLTEDFGERNHQYEAKQDALRPTVRSFQQRQEIKSRDEVKNKDPLIKIKAEEMKKKRKRATPITKHHAMHERERKRKKHLAAREDALQYPIPNGPMQTLRERREKIQMNSPVVDTEINGSAVE